MKLPPQELQECPGLQVQLLDAVSLLTMHQLAGNPLDWFLWHCAVRWLVRWYLLLQRQEAQLHRLEIVETGFPSDRKMASVAYVASSPTVFSSNQAIPGNCSQIIRRGVLPWRKFSRLALIWQASRQFQCLLVLVYNIIYFFVGNLQICWETFNIDCRMFASLHSVLCNMRASQLIF